MPKEMNSSEPRGPSAPEKLTWVAILNGDIEAFRRHLIEAADTVKSYRFRDGMTFLHSAASKGHVEICALLIDAGMDLNDPGPSLIGDPHGVPLLDAAYSGSVETVRLLLSKGALVDGTPINYSTPLMGASFEGHLDVVKVLVEAGADINRQNLNNQYTALDFAIAFEQPAVAEYLRAHGGVSLRPQAVDWSGEPDGAYMACVERLLGPVQATCHSRIVPGASNAVVRVVTINPKQDQKLLLTSGLAEDSGAELAICLDSRWPLNREGLQQPKYSWPLQLLFALSDAVAAGRKIEHATVLSSNDAALEGIELPAATVILASRHDGLNAQRASESALPEIILLHAVRPPTKGATGAWASAAAGKKAKAKWRALEHTPALPRAA
jgi:uncharacterized protein